MVYKENSKEVDMRRLIPIEEKLKDNKYNINKYKNNNKGYYNYEQRDYEKEGFDWNCLYANNNTFYFLTEWNVLLLFL